MAFGRQMGSLKTLKASLAKGGGGQWIKYIPKNGTMNVRFLTEPEDWVNYVEHYDQVLRKSYPCNGMGNCPGCQQGERKTNRYLANVVDLDWTDKGTGKVTPKAVPLQMPKDLANRLVVKYEKWGTLMDRDIELERSGEGLDTVYDLDPAMPSRRKLDGFEKFDLEKVLQNAWDDAFGSGTGDEPETSTGTIKKSKKADEKQPTPAVRTRKRSAAAAVLDEPVQPTPKAKKKKAPKPPEPDFAVDTDDDGTEYTIEELQSMKLGQLRKVAKEEFGIDPTGKTAKVIIKEIEDLPPF